MIFLLTMVLMIMRQVRRDLEVGADTGSWLTNNPAGRYYQDVQTPKDIECPGHDGVEAARRVTSASIGL